jgi:hypothetical protein
MQRISRIGAAGSALLCLLGVTFAGDVAAGASKSITIGVDRIVNAQTTIAKLNQTVVIPAGTFKGGVSAATGKLRGNLKLPPASTTVSLAGIGLADATFSIVPTKSVTGVFNFNNYRLTATSLFNIHVDSVTPAGTDINLVGARCGTSAPVSLAFSGKVSPFSTGNVSGSYTIPKLQHCEAITAVLNAMLAGPGNTFTASMALPTT